MQQLGPGHTFDLDKMGCCEQDYCTLTLANQMTVPDSVYSELCTPHVTPGKTLQVHSSTSTWAPPGAPQCEIS